MKQNKYLIFGVNGMAGHMIAQKLIENGDEVWGFAKEQSPLCKTYIGDALNRIDVENAIAIDSFDYVINGIGVLNRAVDSDLSRGIYLNSYLPHLLSDLLKEKNTKLIHISSDCVFEGTKGLYKEKDLADSNAMYGRTKYLGEVIDKKNLTIRTSIVGPELKNNGVGLFHWFMSQSREVNGYKKVIWGGVTTNELANAILDTNFRETTGLVHLTNNTEITKFDLLCLFNKYCREDKLVIQEELTTVSNRSILNTREDVIYTVPSYEEMIREMYEWINSHKKLYTQYLR